MYPTHLESIVWPPDEFRYTYETWALLHFNAIAVVMSVTVASVKQYWWNNFSYNKLKIRSRVIHLEPPHVSWVSRILEAVLVALQEELQEEPVTKWKKNRKYNVIYVTILFTSGNKLIHSGCIFERFA